VAREKETEERGRRRGQRLGSRFKTKVLLTTRPRVGTLVTGGGAHETLKSSVGWKTTTTTTAGLQLLTVLLNDHGAACPGPLVL